MCDDSISWFPGTQEELRAQFEALVSEYCRTREEVARATRHKRGLEMMIAGLVTIYPELEAEVEKTAPGLLAGSRGKGRRRHE